MGHESTKNQPNGAIMGDLPTNSISFDIYRANLSIEKGLYELELRKKRLEIQRLEQELQQLRQLQFEN